MDSENQKVYDKWVEDFNLEMDKCVDNNSKYFKLAWEFEDNVGIDIPACLKFSSYIFDKYIEMVELDDQSENINEHGLNYILNHTYIDSLRFPFELIENESDITRVIEAHFISLLGVHPSVIYEGTYLKVMFKFFNKKNEYISIDDNLQLMDKLLKCYGKFIYAYKSVTFTDTYIFTDNPNIKTIKSGLVDITIYDKLGKNINYCDCGKWLAICYVCDRLDKYMYNNGKVVLCDRPECYHKVGYIDYDETLADKPCYIGGCDSKHCSIYL